MVRAQTKMWLAAIDVIDGSSSCSDGVVKFIVMEKSYL
jgi:hypothetical protein